MVLSIVVFPNDPKHNATTFQCAMLAELAVACHAVIENAKILAITNLVRKIEIKGLRLILDQLHQITMQIGLPFINFSLQNYKLSFD